MKHLGGILTIQAYKPKRKKIGSNASSCRVNFPKVKQREQGSVVLDPFDPYTQP